MLHFAQPLPDINLLMFVSNALAEAGHPTPNRWVESLVERYPEIHGATQERARLLINRYWNVTLASVYEANVGNERLCLIDDGALATWMQLFNQNVAPTIARLNLPITH